MSKKSFHIPEMEFEDIKTNPPLISFYDLKLLYHDDYWDGPLSGMCMWDDEKLYFFWLKEDKVIMNNSSG